MILFKVCFIKFIKILKSVKIQSIYQLHQIGWTKSGQGLVLWSHKLNPTDMIFIAIAIAVREKLKWLNN